MASKEWNKYAPKTIERIEKTSNRITMTKERTTEKAKKKTATQRKQPTRDFDEWKLEKLWQRNQQTSEFKIVNLASHRTNSTQLN